MEYVKAVVVRDGVEVEAVVQVIVSLSDGVMACVGGGEEIWSCSRWVCLHTAKGS